MQSSEVYPEDGAPGRGTVFTVYTPESELRSPGKLLRAMWHDLWASRWLAWRFLVRDISARYRQSVLGLLWAFLSPIASTAVFVLLYKQGTLKVQETSIPYPAFVMSGTILWTLFTTALLIPLGMGGSTAMLAKARFPPEALILSAVGQLWFDFAVKLVLLAVVFALFGVPFSWAMLLFLPAVLMLTLLGLTLGLLVMPLGTLYQDVSAILGGVVGLWFFLTPVVYPPPKDWPYTLLTDLNPVSPLLVGARELLTHGTLTDVVPFAVVSAVTLAALVVMWVLFRVSLPILVERTSA